MSHIRILAIALASSSLVAVPAEAGGLLGGNAANCLCQAVNSVVGRAPTLGNGGNVIGRLNRTSGQRLPRHGPIANSVNGSLGVTSSRAIDLRNGRVNGSVGLAGTVRSVTKATVTTHALGKNIGLAGHSSAQGSVTKQFAVGLNGLGTNHGRSLAGRVSTSVKALAHKPSSNPGSGARMKANLLNVSLLSRVGSNGRALANVAVLNRSGGNSGKIANVSILNKTGTTGRSLANVAVLNGTGQTGGKIANVAVLNKTGTAGSSLANVAALNGGSGSSGKVVNVSILNKRGTLGRSLPNVAALNGSGGTSGKIVNVAALNKTNTKGKSAVNVALLNRSRGNHGNGNGNGGNGGGSNVVGGLGGLVGGTGDCLCETVKGLLPKDRAGGRGTGGGTPGNGNGGSGGGGTPSNGSGGTNGGSTPSNQNGGSTADGASGGGSQPSAGSGNPNRERDRADRKDLWWPSHTEGANYREGRLEDH